MLGLLISFFCPFLFSGNDGDNIYNCIKLGQKIAVPDDVHLAYELKKVGRILTWKNND